MPDLVRHLRDAAPETPELPVGYLTRISRGDLLTHREEVDLSWRARAGEELGAAIGRLPERHRRVLVWRYGLDGRKRATLAEVSADLGISRERVRQIQLEAEGLLQSGEYGWILLGVVA